MANIVNIFKAATTGSTMTIDVTTSGVTEGNLLLFILAHDGGITQRSVSDVERGAASILADLTSVQAEESSSHTMRVYSYTAAADDAGANTYTITLSGNEQMACFIVEIEESQGIDVSAITANLSDNAPVISGVTTTEDGELIITALSVETAGATTSYPSSYPNDRDTVITTGGGGVRLSMASANQASQGATGSVTWGISAATNSVGIVIGVQSTVIQAPSLLPGYMAGSADIEPAMSGSVNIEPAMGGTVSIEPAMAGSVSIEPL